MTPRARSAVIPDGEQREPSRDPYIPAPSALDDRWVPGLGLSASPGMTRWRVLLHPERLPLLRHDHPGRRALHLGDESVGRRLDDRERAVVARDHRLALDEALH